MSTTDDALVATGGVDGNALLFNRELGKVVGRMKGHSEKVWDLDFAGDAVLTGSADKTARLWQSKGEGKYEVAHKLSLHTDEVTGVTVNAGRVRRVRWLAEMQGGSGGERGRRKRESRARMKARTLGVAVGKERREERQRERCYTIYGRRSK